MRTTLAPGTEILIAAAGFAAANGLFDAEGKAKLLLPSDKPDDSASV